MNQLQRWTVLLSACAMSFGGVANAHPGHGEEGAALTGIRKEMQASLHDAGSKLVELAEATPAGKYNWRPSKESRSTAEVFLHVVTANYGLPMFMGIKPPPDAPVTQETFATFEKSTTDKAKIVALLKQSFENANRAIEQTSEADLDAAMSLFGTPTTKRGGLFTLVNHAHEHLGQSIAYARSNGVVPPWTAREQAAAAAKKKADAGTK